jgi:hypothetical protein
MLLALTAAALAQAVGDVPMGARAITVFVCVTDCEVPFRALSTWAAATRLPVVDFDSLALHLRDDRLLRWDVAINGVRGREPSAGEVEAAWRALQELPYTVSNDDLFLLTLLLGAVTAQSEHPAYADHDWLAVAAGLSGHRSYNLPTMPEPVLRHYLDAAAAPVTPALLRVVADDAAATWYVDGRFHGALPGVAQVEEGLHRVTVERPGRRTAWAGWVEVLGETHISASVAGDDGNAALERVLLAAIDGVPAPAEELAELTRWARDESLEWVRFVSVGHEGSDELLRVDPAAPAWRTRDVYLDVARGRLAAEGPGPNAMLAAADPERFRLGAAVGFLHLDPRDHVTVDLVAGYRFGPQVALEARLGLAHSAQPYYLYDDWIDPQVYPLSLGLRLGRSVGGPYAGVDALAVIPYALGGQARAGWEFAPSLNWRIGVEARLGATDKGWLAGGGVTVASRR